MSGPLDTWCERCGDPLDLDDAHYPHEAGCEYSERGYCYCANITHTDCCWECNPDMSNASEVSWQRPIRNEDGDVTGFRRPGVWS